MFPAAGTERIMFYDDTLRWRLPVAVVASGNGRKVGAGMFRKETAPTCGPSGRERTSKFVNVCYAVCRLKTMR